MLVTCPLDFGQQSYDSKVFGLGRLGMLASRLSDLAWQTTTLVISNKDMEDVMKVVKSFEEFGYIDKRFK